ncbi:MAG: ATP-binding cassette domain-containing protein, partial [Candidatus Bipolaricaulota bacterium]
MSLKLENISKSFFLPGQRVHALRSVSLCVEPEEFVTVIGSNGAGKSTLLDIIAGVRHPEAGRVHIAKRDVTSRSAHRRARWVGRVFQDPLKGPVPE